MKLRVTLTSKPGIIPIGATITLRKQPGNQYDDEAIEVVLGDKPAGYVVQFYKLRKPGTVSAGRLLDKIPDTCNAVIIADQVGEVEVA